MTKRQDIIDILKKEQEILKERFGIKRIAIFGSFASDTANDQSDVDIYAEFERPIGIRFLQLSDFLEEKLGKKTDILTSAGLENIRIKKVADHIRRSIIYV